MKKTLLFILIFALIFSFSNCKKTQSTDEESGESTNAKESSESVESVTQYIKESVWAFEKEEDLQKAPKEVKEKKLLEFGNKITVIKKKKIEDKEYYNIQMPDKTKLWVSAKNVTEKFIIINQSDVATYSQPEQDYKTGVKLQPGDFGIFVKEQDGWINVEFYAYRPLKDGEERKWVGNKWIKESEGYTEDILAAREAYNLYMAYFYKISKNDNTTALKYVKLALDANKGDKSEIYPVIENFQKELE